MNILSFFPLQKLFALIIIFSNQFDAYSQNMEFEKSLYDFRQVRMNTKQVHELKFKNTGEDTLIIKSEPKTASSADIAQVKDSKIKFAPGEEGAIIYEFDTKSAKYFYNNIIIQSNNNNYVVRTKWEVLPENVNPQTWEDKINSDPELRENISAFYAYESMINNYRMPDPHNDHLNQLRADSIRNLCVEKMGSIFTIDDLKDVFTYSEDLGVQLISFEALSRTNYNSDSLVALLERYCMNKSIIFRSFEGIINHGIYGWCLRIIYPYDKKYNISIKLDLEQYVYLNFLNSYYALGSVFIIHKAVSFGTLDTLDFHTIDLSIYKKENFELHGKLKVVNVSDKTIIIAPYYDTQTTCDKRSYNLNSKGTIDIDFRSVVKLKEGEQTIKRAIRIVDYKTMEEKTVWIKAKFINYKKE